MNSFPRICTHCGQDLSETGLETVRHTTCPVCRNRIEPAPPSWRTGSAFIRSYLNDVFRILFHPVVFFRNMPLSGGLSHPLTFALATHWLGVFFSFFWKQSLLLPFTEIIRNTMRAQSSWNMKIDDSDLEPFSKASEAMAKWVSGAGPVLLDPFWTLFSILLTASFVFIGARLLVPTEQRKSIDVRYESAVRIVSFGLTPSILSAIPLLGPFVSWIYVIIVTVIGAREAYRVGNFRAILIALFPKVLFLSIILLIMISVAAVIFHLFWTAF